MKSDIEIVDNIYAALRGSRLVAEVTGALCKRKRVPNATTEDVCISVVANDDYGHVQTATAYVRVYVQNILEGGQLQRNDKRCRELAQLCDEALHAHNGDGFRFYLSAQQTYEVEGGKEHAIVNKLIYNQIND